jgi:hypothetical protein
MTGFCCAQTSAAVRESPLSELNAGIKGVIKAAIDQHCD